MSDRRTAPIRVGVIGAGFMGSRHARLVTESADAQLCGIVDVDEELGVRVSSRLGTQWFHDIEALLDEDIDGVVVATPEGDHRHAVEAAAAAGCAVLVEKPIATSVEDADEMIEACRQAGVALLVGHILRHEAAYVALRQAVVEGSPGRLLSGYARRNAVIEEGRRLAARTNVIQYLAIHDVDMLLWLHPEPVTTVSAQAVHGRIHEAFGTPDLVWLLLRFGDGVLGVVECGWALPEGWGGWAGDGAWQPFGDCRMDLIGTDDVLSLDMRSMNVVGVDKRGWRFPETRHWPVINGRIGGAALIQMRHFLDCVARRAEPVCNGGAGRAALEVCLAAEASLAGNGQEATVGSVER